MEVEVSIASSPRTSEMRAQGPFASAPSKDELIIILQQRLDASEKMNLQLSQQVEQLKRKLDKVRRERLNASDMKFLSNLEKIFTSDQLSAIINGRAQGSKWSDETITVCLRIKYACGSSGYNELRRLNYPLASERTLRERTEGIQFEEGVFEFIWDLIEEKIAACGGDTSSMCDVVLAFDEIALQKGQRYDSATKSYVGKSSFPNANGEYEDAAHSLIFILAGIRKRWKQIVAHYYTPSSMNGRDLKPVVDKIIIQAEAIGLRVHLVVSDMGPINQALWSSYNVGIAGRFSRIINSIQHPCDPKRRLWFSADPGHLEKNLKSCLISNKTIDLPAEIVAKHNLPSGVVKCSHIKELCDLQEGDSLKAARKLNPAAFDNKNHFAKMKVCIARQFLSHEVSAGLRLMGHVLETEEFEVTATFFDYVVKWFTIITSRHGSVALGKTPGMF